MQCLFLLWYFPRPLSMVLHMQKPKQTAEGAQGQEHKPSSQNTDPLQKAIGARIRKCREARGIAQETFAYEAGLNRAWYGAVERGRYNVTASNLARIALALDVEVGDLFPDKTELAALLGDLAREQ
jgi:DNA-binding XRE family transcriptional regulator